MVPSGSPAPAGGAQSVPPALLRTNSVPNSIPSQQQFSSLVSPRTQFANTSTQFNSNSLNTMNLPNAPSLLNHSFPNGGPVPMESSPLGFTSSSDQSHSQQLEGVPNFNQPQAQIRGALGNVGPLGPVKLEPPTGPGPSDQNNGLTQHLQSLRGLAPVKMEAQHMQSVRALGPDNNIEFWRKFVAEYFAPHAKKRWCVSLYGNGRQTTGVFPQDVWHCEICNRKPGRGFETTVEVLPRLFQIKYASGTLEELLYVDMPREYQNASGQVILDYAKAVQESVFEQLRVVREGQLRIVYSPDLKICSWEFCARRHEELIPRRLLIPQVSQLGAVVQKYQNAAQNASPGLFSQDLQNTCNSFVASARQLAKSLEVPLVNDLGYTKRYVRCLQISEVVNSMKDLIDYSRETRSGPMDSLINFPRRPSASSVINPQPIRRPEEQPSISQNATQNNQTGPHPAGVQLSSANNNGAVSANNSTSTITGLIHQNSMNGRQDNHINSVSSPYGGGGGNTVQIPSASSSNSIPPSQPNQNPSATSPFPSPTPSSNNNTAPPSHNANNSNMPLAHPTPIQEPDPNESQSSVQQILQEMMMHSQLNGVNSLGHDMKGINGGMGYGGMGPSGSTASVLRAAMANNVMAMNGGRVGMSHMSHDPNGRSNHHHHHHHQQQRDIGNRMLSGVDSVNSFNNLQFEWKTSP
ncbi:Transcriptional corepressor SEUSS [Ananas comosus]|uniref:Transcriptional corepressor SEUSS n=1 Tax=Ananas comosus TaxID=4615 RepID=A0A199W227_ANACO|nr:Transcriptional corepressor SEUSS [Ananas comosus]